MADIYKGHEIASGAQHNPDTDQYTPTLQIAWDEGGTRIFRPFLFKHTFDTADEARTHAHRFALDWIDKGKPDVPPPC
jgi:hypothetical protein